MSGFTGAGYPKEVPQALARRIEEANASGAGFRINVWTGASTAPELDGALAAADGIELRLPYQSDPVSRAKINDGAMEYIDVHLSHVAQMVWEGFLGHLDVALVEVSAITEDGSLVPSSSATTRRGSTRRTRSSSRSTPGRAPTSTGCTTSTTARRGAAAGPAAHPAGAPR
jgi:succinyl-CoA:acetate CoA-transferase